MKKKLKLLGSEKFIGISFCILLAFLTWLSIKLSNKYTERITLNVHYANLPLESFLTPNSTQTIDAVIEGSGFSLLNYNLSKKNISLDINQLSHIGNDNYLLSKSTLNLIDYNVMPDVSLKNIYPDTLKIGFQKLAHKKVPVIIKMPIETQTEYQVSEIVITPSAVTLHGLSADLDSITGLYLNLPPKINVKKSFTEKISLKNTKKLHYDTKQIQIKTDVIRVSEQEMVKSVEILHAPTNKKIHFFPNKVKIIVSGDINILQSLEETDVVIIADYVKHQENWIPLEVYKAPKGTRITFDTKKIEFLIQK